MGTGVIFSILVSVVALMICLGCAFAAIHPTTPGKYRTAFGVYALLAFVFCAAFLWAARNWEVINGG